MVKKSRKITEEILTIGKPVCNMVELLYPFKKISRIKAAA